MASPTPEAHHPTPQQTFDHAWITLMLAPTPEIWQALLLGEPVNEDALDQTWLRRLRAAGVIE